MMLFVLLLFFSLSFGGSTVKEIVLSNGVKVLLKQTRGKGIVSGYVFIKSGTHGEEKRGLTNLMSTLLTKGTKSFSSYQIASAFEDYGGNIYSSTSDDYVEIGFSTKVEGLPKAFEVLREILYSPSFNQEDLEREKSNAIAQIKAKRERAQELAMDQLRRITYKGTSYEYSPLGKEDDIQTVTKEDIEKRWKDILRSKNVVVSLVGDFKEEQIRAYIEQTFSAIPEGEYIIRTENASIQEDQIQRVSREGSQATIVCAFEAPSILSKDYFSFKVLASVLGEGMTSKLFKELRENKGYAYATYAYYPSRLASPRLFAYIGTSPQNEEGALRDLIEVIKNANITQEDVQLAKSKIVGSFLLDHQTRYRQAWYLGFFEIMGFGWQRDEEYPNLIQSITLEDVVKVREYIKDHQCVIVKP